ncbi:uncharacterized protein A4U43_C10F280 [Asparagus officinalis]|uniref:Uncharacterized protein n=1 Tax=Asparagus officinalis TaxID=4686 RepID=A0A5P1E2I9_ASPOF|nr:uncharacterized protein A4U43_C10F280 [Asparagus officinalis]
MWGRRPLPDRVTASHNHTNPSYRPASHAATGSGSHLGTTDSGLVPHRVRQRYHSPFSVGPRSTPSPLQTPRQRPRMVSSLLPPSGGIPLRRQIPSCLPSRSPPAPQDCPRPPSLASTRLPAARTSGASSSDRLAPAGAPSQASIETSSLPPMLRYMVPQSLTYVLRHRAFDPPATPVALCR